MTLASHMNLSSSGQDLTLTSGCLDMAGFNLNIGGASGDGTLTLESGTTINQGGGALSYGDLRGGPRFSDRLLRWSPDPTGGIWNATQETELPG